MPHKAVNYNNTIIYKIQHHEKPELLYIGSTTSFSKRKCQHKSNCYNENNKSYSTKLYKMIRDNGGWNEFNMIEIKKFPCQSKREAEAEEDRIMSEMKASMNTYRAFLTAEGHKLYEKEYYAHNKQQINKYRSIKLLCECGCYITRRNVARHVRSFKHINLINQIL